MDKFMMPEVEVIELETENIVITSTGDGGLDTDPTIPGGDDDF